MFISPIFANTGRRLLRNWTHLASISIPPVLGQYIMITGNLLGFRPLASKTRLSKQSVDSERLLEPYIYVLLIRSCGLKLNKLCGFFLLYIIIRTHDVFPNLYNESESRHIAPQDSGKAASNELDETASRLKWCIFINFIWADIGNWCISRSRFYTYI